MPPSACGNIANTGNVQVGSSFSNLSAPTTLTHAGPTDANRADFNMFGSASQPVTLAFSTGIYTLSLHDALPILSNAAPLTLNNAFTNSATGTVALDGKTALTITGAF